MRYNRNNYLDLCKTFHVPSLESRSNVSDMRNLNKIITNSYNCTELVEKIGFYVPQRTLRRNRLFSVQCRINTRKYSFIPRAQSLSNVNSELDIFEIDPFVFRRKAEDVFY